MSHKHLLTTKQGVRILGPRTDTKGGAAQGGVVGEGEEGKRRAASALGKQATRGGRGEPFGENYRLNVKYQKQSGSNTGLRSAFDCNP